MAWIEERAGRTGTTTYRVIWRQNDIGRQQQTFAIKPAAERFKKAVERAGNRWPNDRPRATPTVQGPTFEEWARRTIAARTQASPRTKADYLAQLERHVFPILGGIPLNDIGREDVAEWVGSVDRSAKTVANLHALCSSIMLDAVAEHLARRNPFAGMRRDVAAVRTEEMVFLTPGEFAQVVNACPEWYRPLIITLGGTGLRWGEASALQVRDVHLLGERNTITVVRAWKRTEDSTFELGEPKTRRSRRTIAIGAEVVDALLPLVAGKQPEEFVFTTQANGLPVRHSNFRQRVWVPTIARAACCDRHRAEQQEDARRRRVRFGNPKPCGCPGTLTKQPRIHDLRHSHISWLIAAGVPLPAIQRRAGHSTITTTIDRYGHLMPELDEQINRAVDRALLHST